MYGKEIKCKIKGNFRLKGIRSTNPIAVGDRVEIENNKDGCRRPFISKIEPREKSHYTKIVKPFQTVSHSGRPTSIKPC